MAPPPAATAAATASPRGRVGDRAPYPAVPGVAQKLLRPGAPRSGSSRPAHGAAFEGAAPPPVGEGSSPSCPSPWWWPPCWPSSWGRRSWPTARCRWRLCSTSSRMEQSAHRQAEWPVAQLETPARIVAAATEPAAHGPRSQRHRAALRLTVRAPPHPEGDARTRSTTADNLLGGCGRAVGGEYGQCRDGVHLGFRLRPRRRHRRDAVSVTTRPEADRARAGSGPSEHRRDDLGVDRGPPPGPAPASPARPARPARPPQPGRRPTRRAPPPGAGAAHPATRPRQRPHRPPAKVSRLPLSRQRRGWESGTFTRRVRLVRFVLLAAMLLLVARLVDVQVAALRRRTRRRRGASRPSPSPSPRCAVASTTATDRRWPSPSPPTTSSPTTSRSRIR